MNSDIIQGSWEQVKGKVQATWGKLTDDDMMEIKGDAKALSGKLQKHYGWKKEEAEKYIAEFNDKNRD